MWTFLSNDSTLIFAEFSQSCVQNHSLGSLWPESLAIFLVLSDWLSLLQLHLLPCLVFCLFCSGNTKLLMGSQTHQNASYPCLCSLSCPACKHPSLSCPLCKLFCILENSAPQPPSHLHLCPEHIRLFLAVPSMHHTVL